MRTDKLGLSLRLERKTGFVVVFVVIGATAAAASLPIILCRTIRTMKPIRRVCVSIHDFTPYILENRQSWAERDAQIFQVSFIDERERFHRQLLFLHQNWNVLAAVD